MSFDPFASCVADMINQFPAPVACCRVFFATMDTPSGTVSPNKPSLLLVALGHAVSPQQQILGNRLFVIYIYSYI